MPSHAVAATGARAPGAAPNTVRAFFFISAPADPGLLPRLIEPVAKLGAVPSRVHASRESGDGSELNVDLRLVGVARVRPSLWNTRCAPWSESAR